MSRVFSGASRSNSSSVTITYFSLLTSKPRTTSSASRSLPVFSAKYFRASGCPSGPSIRSDVRFERVAGNKLTGTLTSPNVSVPDQNGLPPAFSSSGSSLLRLALGGTFLLLPQRLDALREHIVESRRLAFRLHGLQLRRASLRLLLDKFHHAPAILVFVFLCIELALQHLHQLRRHRDLFLCWGRSCRLCEIVCEDHFIRISQRKQEEIISDGTERASVVFLAHHPVGDSFTLFVSECLDKREVIFFVTIRTSVVGTLVPLLADLRLRNKLDDLDVA